MSSTAIGFVYEHSPFKGATFAVHCAIGDSMNDQNDNELWMSIERLAEKARVERKTASRAVAALLDGGWLELLEERPGRPSRYRFLFPDAPVVYEVRNPRNRRKAGRQDPGPSNPGRQDPGSDTAGVGRGDPAPGSTGPGGGSTGPANPSKPNDPNSSAAPVDSDGEPDPSTIPGRIEKAAVILGRADHERARDRGAAIADHKAYRNGCINRRRESDDLIALADKHPTWTAAQLADRLAASQRPDDMTQAAAFARMAANAERAAADAAIPRATRAEADVALADARRALGCDDAGTPVLSIVVDDTGTG